MSSSVLSTSSAISAGPTECNATNYTSFIQRDETSFGFLLRLQFLVEKRLSAIQTGAIKTNLNSDDVDAQEKWTKCLEELAALQESAYVDTLQTLGPKDEILAEFRHLFLKYLRKGILSSSVRIKMPKLTTVLAAFVKNYVNHWKVKELAKYTTLNHEDLQGVAVDVLRMTLKPIAVRSIVSVKKKKEPSLLIDHLPTIKPGDSVSLASQQMMKENEESSSKVSVLVKENPLEKMQPQSQPQESSSQVSRSSNSSRRSRSERRRSRSERRRERKQLMRQLMQLIKEEDEDDNTTHVG